MSGTASAAGLAEIVIVGAGQGGFQAAMSLRDGGFQGRIRLIGDEPGLPYQRPPLSKAYLTGKSNRTSLDLRPAEFFAKFEIEVLPGRRIAAIDRTARQVRTTGGDSYGYDHLILATGTRNRPLPVPGIDLGGVCGLRTAADGDVLRPRLSEIRRMAIVGAGFIGLEVAAVAAAMGVEVTVFEAMERPMARALSPQMSAFFRQAHEAAGVRLLFGTTVQSLEGAGGKVSAVRTADGKIFETDFVLVGIGVVPNSELASEAGLTVGNGIVVDETLLTSDPDISAIGDCAIFPQYFAAGAAMRIESVQTATDHARCVAARLTGKAHSYRAVPWFWSDQGPLKLQIAGLSMPHETAVLRGDPASRAFSVFCFGGGKLVGVESVNKAADHMMARRLLGAHIPLTPDEAADTGFDLKARASSTQAVTA